MADIKRECGQLAHEGAQRVAMAGFGVLCGWWYLVYRLTFETDRVGSNGTCDSKFKTSILENTLSFGCWS